MPLVTVARFTDPPAAHVTRALLEANGIDAYLRNEFYVGMDWLHSQAVGGVELQVAAEQAAQAAAIIAQPPQLPSPSDEGEGASDRVGCPVCEGDETEADGWDRRVRAASLGLGIPAAIGAYRYRCLGCGHRWRQLPPHRGLRARLRDVASVLAGFLLTILLAPLWFAARLFGSGSSSQLECWACGVPFREGEPRCGECGVLHPPALAFARVIEVGRPYDEVCPQCHTPYMRADYVGSSSDWRSSICHAPLSPT